MNWKDFNEGIIYKFSGWPAVKQLRASKQQAAAASTA
jgi:hypothetical protein